MKQRSGSPAGRRVTSLLQGGSLGLLCLQAHAAEPASGAEAVAQLTQPAGEVEVGVGAVTSDSYKFGEYNGLQRKGAYAIGGFSLSGGGLYDSNSVSRWSLLGTELGLDTRQVQGDFREQGLFQIDLGYDQLRHNTSDTYQTPYLGAGSEVLQLPASWLKPVVPQVSPTNLNERALSPITGLASAVTPNGQVAPPTAAQAARVNSIINADVPAFHHYDLYTNRYRWNGALSVNLSRSWVFSAGVIQERRDGAQPIGVLDSQVQENSVVIPARIDTVTNQFNAGLRYSGKKGFLDIGYYASLFHNNVSSITWDDPANRGPPVGTASFASAPDNQFHQINLSGGYDFSPGTRLAISGSYGRSSQDAPFLGYAAAPIGLPETSLDALIVSKVVDAKLTMRPLRKLNLVADYKYDDQANETNVATFVFYDVNILKGATASSFNAALGLPAGTLGSNVNIFDNRPHSRRLSQGSLDADFSVAPGQNLAAGFQWQGIKRACHDTWIDCENADTTNENSVRGEWRSNWAESLSSRFTYTQSNRSVDYNTNAWLALVPMANVIPRAPTVGATTSVYGYLLQSGLTGFGPLAGFPSTPLTGNAAIFSPNNNIVPQALYGSRDNVSELPGLRRFNVADRRRDKARSSLDWQATERLSLQAGAEYNKDDYEHSTYGLQESRGWAANLQASYAVDEDFELPVFYTHEDQRSLTAGDGYGSNTNAAFVGVPANTVVSGGCYSTVLQKNTNGKLDPCLRWSTSMRERADTIGATLSRTGIEGGRLSLAGDVIYTYARTDIGVRGGSYANNPFALAGAPALPAGVPAVYFIPATALPGVTTRLLEVRLRAQVALGKASLLSFVAQYQRLRSSDFAYQGTQFGTGTEQLPTLEQAFNYSVGVFGVSYIYRF
jgi:MtrB/PioB family decaheme-associated outer membrane protein